jgi:hypothetical protein
LRASKVADFCHDYEPGGLGCRGECTKPQCFGDFTEDLVRRSEEVDPGFILTLGICEGHGANVYLLREDDGKLYFKHGPGRDFLKGKEIEVPEPVEVRE